MAFNMGNAGNALGGGNIQYGPELKDIQTEWLGFLTLSGQSVQLLPSPWPSDNLPPPTASLMSIASRQGLLAAAGPDTVIVASIESVRQAFQGPSSGNQFKPFEPQLKIPMPMRISQVAFSADEAYLVLSAESGGGLRVYDVNSILQGSTQPAFDIPTHGLALRTLLPNPKPEKGELFAIVTTDGKLLVANLKERNFIQGPSGQVLKDGVSCISWSAKGKQLVAGLGDGTAYQLTPEGVGKAELPRPPNMGNNHHISSMTWLENDVFLLVHTPSNPDPGGMAPESLFHIMTRQSPQFMFQKIPEAPGPFGLNRSPPHHFILRLREFPPNIQDLLIVASSASTDIGLFSRSKVPLTKDVPADEITNVFTMTEMYDDSKRAQLPMSGMDDTSPIGMALDLSSREKVKKPVAIDADEIDESPTPLPAVMVLNNIGVLASWWVIYVDSIRQATAYPGLVAVQGTTQSMQPAPAPAMTTAPAFGRPALGGGAAFGSSSALSRGTSVWGTPAGTTAPQTGGSAFGSPSDLGPARNTPSAFGTPAFGSAGLPGNRSSPWGSASTSTTGAAFGQASGLGKPTSVFGSATPSSGSAAPASGGYSNYASHGGFAAAAQNSSGSVFAKPSAFGAPSTSSDLSSASTFGKPDEQRSGAFGSGGFILGSGLKDDNSAKDAPPDASTDTKGSLFGRDFEKSLDDAEQAHSAQAPVSQEADMDVMEDIPKPEISKIAQSTTPTTTPAAQRSQDFASAAPIKVGLFGAPSLTRADTTTNAESSAGPSTLNKTEENPEKAKAIAQPDTSATTPPAQTTSTVSHTPASPKIKEEPAPDDEQNKVNKNLLEAPLPPDSTSKDRFGDSSNSSVEADAPLPPDLVSKPAKSSSQRAPPEGEQKSQVSRYAGDVPPLDVPGGPEEGQGKGQEEGPEDNGDDSGFSSPNEDDAGDDQSEGSGEDVAKDLTPVSETNQTPGFTPQSSSTGMPNRGTDSGLFTKIEKPTQQGQQRSLFGEVGGSAPVLPPPKVQASPRSPSPVRNAIPPRMLRPSPSRSLSASGVASQILGPQSLSGRPSTTFAASLEQARAQEKRRADIRDGKQKEETQPLVDDEDEKMQQFLSEDIKGTKTLDEFVAHSDYVSRSTNNSIPAQVETVYRDINSMIDILGVNAKALESFIVGHTEQYKEVGRNIEDLGNAEDWCLVEVDNLSKLIQKDLTQELEGGRITEVDNKLEVCDVLMKDIVRLRMKYNEVRSIMASLNDPEQLEHARVQPLNSEEAAQQYDLRKEFTKFQKLLCEAEEGLIILKVKLSSQASSAGKSSTAPTVEAVMRTITKMTSMAEKRSGDIDVLEGQMCRLRFSFVTSTRSREGSPFATPQNKSTLREPSTSSTYGIFYTPDSIKENGRGLRSSLMSSTSSPARSLQYRKKMSDYTPEEKILLRQKLARKSEVASKLRNALQKAGTKVRLMTDDD